MIERLRKICLALPGATEKVSFGHPTFQISGKTFCVLDVYKGQTAIAVKVGKAIQGIFLNDPCFYITPYIGKRGWVSLKTDSKLNWKEIAELAKGSYELVSPGTSDLPKRQHRV